MLNYEHLQNNVMIYFRDELREDINAIMFIFIALWQNKGYNKINDMKKNLMF